ncbi:uroporphyrinogen-III synthase [Plantibacter flavus]|uniref:uroporphyrinogen-III synthase n=1 Tax=Plantibacter flavus TaxID=150123 RepID=UPI003F1374D6
MTHSLEQHLAGCVILVTAERRSTELASALERRGAVIRHAPSLSMLPLDDDVALAAATRSVIDDPPDIVVATTGIGFRSWIDSAESLGLGDELLAVLGRARIVARGPKARGAIQAAGLNADWVAESETSTELAEFLLAEGVDGRNIAIQYHGSGADGIDELFRAAGARVQTVIVYRWGPPRDPALVVEWAARTAAGEVDAVVFTSAPAAAAWIDATGDGAAREQLVDMFSSGAVTAFAVGPITAAPLRAVGIDPVVPSRGRLGALVREVISHFADRADGPITTVVGSLVVRNARAVLDGEPLPLSPSSFAVLRALARRPGVVVSRDALLAELPGEAVTPHAVDVTIGRLRETLGDPAVIRTVVRRGYRLDPLEEPA